RGHQRGARELDDLHLRDALHAGHRRGGPRDPRYRGAAVGVRLVRGRVPDPARQHARRGRLAYRWFVCLMGVAVALLCISGIWVFWKKFKQRRARAAKDDKAVLADTTEVPAE